MPARKSNTTTLELIKGLSSSLGSPSSSAIHSKEPTTGMPGRKTSRVASMAATDGGRTTSRRIRNTQATRIARIKMAMSSSFGTEETTQRPSAEHVKCSRSSSDSNSSTMSKCIGMSNPDKETNKTPTATTHSTHFLLGRQLQSRRSLL